MYATVTIGIEINDRETPKHNEYIRDEYELRKDAKQILLARLLRGEHEIREVLEYAHAEINKKSAPTWSQLVTEEAENFIKEYMIDEMVEAIENNESIETELYNYEANDSAFHETIIDRDYDLTDAMELVNELSEFEENDEGIWEGEDVNGILRTKAAFTYGNAVNAEINEILESVSNEIDPEDYEDATSEEIKQAILDAI